MTVDYRFDIRPNGGNGVQVILSGTGQPVAGQPYQRTLPALDANVIDALRRGEVQPAAFDQLTENVSDWFFNPDLRAIVSFLIQQHNNDLLRLVFTIDPSLQTTFGEVPIELLRTDPHSDPLVVHHRVASVLQLLPKVGVATAGAGTLDWPMRILLVRSNPGDLGNRVPEAIPIRDNILKLGEEFGPNLVRVDVLSSEADSMGPATWEGFRTAVRSQYHVLVYLGHGDVQQLHADLPALAQLQFESDDPAVHEPVTAKQLANVLRQNPIPVVVLAGCLTAAAPGAGPLSGLSAWMRGNQGVAQALVNSESGVLFAVGMRSQIDAGYAALFIKEFFRSLFGVDRGNVEMAVRAARMDLFQRQPYPPNWAAPIAFSSLAQEPMFGYLTRQVNFTMTKALVRELDIRKVIWSTLADELPGNRRPSVVALVESNRNAIRTEALAQGAILFPETANSSPGKSVVMSVLFEGNAALGQLQAKLFLAPELSFVEARATQRLSDAGYQVLNDAEQAGVFQIQLRPGAAKPLSLPTGVILEIDLQVDGDARGILPVNLEVLSTDVNQPLWPGNNAVIVTAA